MDVSEGSRLLSSFNITAPPFAAITDALSIGRSSVAPTPTYALNLVAEMVMLFNVPVTLTSAPTLMFFCDPISNFVIAS